MKEITRLLNEQERKRGGGGNVCIKKKNGNSGKRIADLEREVQSQQNEKILKNVMEYCYKMTEKRLVPILGGKKANSSSKKFTRRRTI
ncbi:MAG: hypothetical protein HFI77_10525 [Lachnospiraceae bacterium]|nr:hypothetical protein [Lachnospiraceae bacterium]